MKAPIKTIPALATAALIVAITATFAAPAAVQAVPAGEVSLEQSLAIDLFVSSGNAEVNPLAATNDSPFTFLSNEDDDAPVFSFDSSADFEGFSLSGIVLERESGETVLAEITRGNGVLLDIIKTLTDADTLLFGDATDITTLLAGDSGLGSSPGAKTSSTPEPATAMLAGLAVFAIAGAATRRRRA